MDESLREELTQKIVNAFSTTPYPGDDNIGGGDPFDGVSVEEDFRGKHWQEISLELLLLHHAALPFLSPQAYRFYLPAYLLGVLFYFEDVDLYDLPSRIIKTLAPPNEANGRFLKIVSSFTPQEKDAIYSFLSTYKILFPDELWSYLVDEHNNLDSATEFWEKGIASNS